MTLEIIVRLFVFLSPLSVAACAILILRTNVTCGLR
jgi:hypothetical protein